MDSFNINKLDYQYDENRQDPYDYTNAKKPDKEPKTNRFKEHFSTLLILIAAPLLAVLITVFVFRTYQVDGPSMETTLQDNDRLIINKVPRTLSKITHNDYIPKRYNIIVFNHQGEFSGSDVTKRQLIKRVIAVPGDRIVIKDSVVTIYNSENPNGLLVDKVGPEAAVIENTSGNIDETIGEGEVFVMGDNRANSLDSRNLGTVRSEDIIGKLNFRLYPFSKWESY